MADVEVDQDRHAILRITTRHPITKEIQNISGAHLEFQVKKTRDWNAPIVFSKKNEAGGGTGIYDYDLDGGIYKVYLDPVDTTGVGDYYCETKMLLSGKESTIFKRRFVVNPSTMD